MTTSLALKPFGEKARLQVIKSALEAGRDGKVHLYVQMSDRSILNLDWAPEAARKFLKDFQVELEKIEKPVEAPVA